MNAILVVKKGGHSDLTHVWPEDVAYNVYLRMTGKNPVGEMVDWDDFDYAEPALERELDEYEVSARNTTQDVDL